MSKRKVMTRELIASLPLLIPEKSEVLYVREWKQESKGHSIKFECLVPSEIINRHVGEGKVFGAFARDVLLALYDWGQKEKTLELNFNEDGFLDAMGYDIYREEVKELWQRVEDALKVWLHTRITLTAKNRVEMWPIICTVAHKSDDRYFVRLNRALFNDEIE